MCKCFPIMVTRSTVALIPLLEEALNGGRNISRSGRSNLCSKKKIAALQTWQKCLEWMGSDVQPYLAQAEECVRRGSWKWAWS